MSIRVYCALCQQPVIITPSGTVPVETGMHVVGGRLLCGKCFTDYLFQLTTLAQPPITDINLPIYKPIKTIRAIPEKEGG
jgi:hypothetical protein